MPPPTSYTEDELASFMLAELGDVGADLGIKADETALGTFGDMTEPVNDVLLDYGTDDISTVTSSYAIRGLRALGSVHAWRLAQKRAAARYDMADGSQNLKRSQLFGQIAKQLQIAEGTAAALGVGAPGSTLVVKVGTIRYTQDPYAPIDESADAIQ